MQCRKMKAAASDLVNLWLWLLDVYDEHGFFVQNLQMKVRQLDPPTWLDVLVLQRKKTSNVAVRGQTKLVDECINLANF